MESFTFALPTRVVFGSGSIDAVGRETAPLGNRALVVTGSTFARRSGMIDRLRRTLQDAGVEVLLFDNLSPNPRVESIDAGAAEAREKSADVIIGLGGGSVMDAAKAIAVGARSGRSIWDYVRAGLDGEAAPIESALPLVQVPIVASTGSETNNRAVVFREESRSKAWLESPHLYARVAVVDPILTFTVPPSYTAVGAMNIVSRMLEVYLASDEFPVTDRITEGLMRVVMDSLPRAMRRGEDLDARTNLSWISAFGWSVTASHQSRPDPISAMAQPLSARFEVDYGSVLAALWPSYMRYVLGNRSRLPQLGRFKRYALLGRQIFGVHETDDEVAAETTTYRFVNWLKAMNMPINLRELRIDTDDTRTLAEQAIILSGNGRYLAGGLSVEDVENIYEGALLLRS